MAISDDIGSFCAPLLAEGGVESVAVEYQREPSGWVLRFFLDKAGGFSLEDCAVWSRRLGDALEPSGLLKGSFALEVSSPGLNRPLRKRQDYERYTGIDVVLKLFAPINNQRNFHGLLQGVHGNEVWLVDRTSGLVKLPLDGIAGAKLDPIIDVNKEMEKEAENNPL